jgi:hypothetical protein
MEKLREKKRKEKPRSILAVIATLFCNFTFQFFFFSKRVEKSVQYSSYKIKPSPWVPMALNSVHPPRPAPPLPSPPLSCMART